MYRRSLVYPLLAVATFASAGPIFLIADNNARTLFLQTETVRQESEGLVAFTMRAVAKHGYRPTGASETIAIALTDYQMDCWRSRVRETGTRYVTDEDKEAGRPPKRPVQKGCSIRLKMFQQTSEQPSFRNAS
ncbi:hypothetical protein [Burkholderia latens]|uniref:hypothetical protein n=1 Tax=Burkholderia latens TaxID=488446 RepID=UPI00158CA70C|nr:hypothetical protein [Burkholderia latens]